MAGQDRQPDHPLTGAGLEDARRFSFFQLVRLLERHPGIKARVGHQGPAAAEALRFRPNTSLSFPATDVAEATPGESTAERPYRVNLTTNFLGLYGSTSPLPSFYSEQILWQDQEDNSVRGLLDLFHHRLISLFYRCWAKYRPAVQFEYRGDDRHTPRLFSLIGLGTQESREEAELPDTLSLLRYVGLLNQQPHSATALEAILTDYFAGVPVRLEQCTPRWVRIVERQRARLGQANCRLASDCSIGSRALGRRGSFRVWLGPLPWARYLEFLPDQEDTRVLGRLIRLFAPDHLDYELGLRVKKVPRLKLATRGAAASRARLGYTTWLHSKAPKAKDEETVLFGPDSLRTAQPGRPTKEEAA